MTDIVFIVYSCFAASLAVSLLTAMVFRFFISRRRSKWAETLKNKYLHISVMSMMSHDCELPRFPMIKRPGARQILAEVVAGLVSSTSGMDMEPLRDIVEKNGVDLHLMRCAGRARGYRRARYLSMLAGIPIRDEVVKGVLHYDKSSNIYVRFYAMMVRINADPSSALDVIAGCGYDLSVFEISEIMAMLRRGVFPIAYGPLLESDDRNIKLLGLGIVRRFGIEEAERDLLRIAATEGASELGIEALYTLCSMQKPVVGRAAVRMCINGMDRYRRKALLRYMAISGYSVDALRELFDRAEQPYLEAIVDSFKRRIKC